MCLPISKKLFAFFCLWTISYFVFGGFFLRYKNIICRKMREPLQASHSWWFKLVHLDWELYKATGPCFTDFYGYYKFLAYNLLRVRTCELQKSGKLYGFWHCRFVQFGPEVKCHCGAPSCQGYLGTKRKIGKVDICWGTKRKRTSTSCLTIIAVWFVLTNVIGGIVMSYITSHKMWSNKKRKGKRREVESTVSCHCFYTIQAITSSPDFFFFFW